MKTPASMRFRIAATKHAVHALSLTQCTHSLLLDRFDSAKIRFD